MLGPLGSLLVGVGLILFLLLYLRIHPFLALVVAALGCAIFSDRIPLEAALPTVAGGFADLMGKIGILLVLASIVGKCLVDSGSADRIIRAFTRAFGEKREQYSFLSSGFVLAMPVFFDTVFYLLAPLIRAAYARRKSGYTLMICAAAAGGAVTHALVPPTPGPIVVSQTLGVSLGITVLMGIVLSIVPAAVGGLWYGGWLNKRLEIHPKSSFGVSEEELERTSAKPDSELPSLGASLAPVVVPVVMISLSTLGAIWTDGKIPVWLALVGDKDLAFLLGAVLAVWVMARSLKLSVREISDRLEPAIVGGTTVAFITCGGGAFGKALTDAGVGGMIAEAAKDWGMSLILMAFLTAALIRIAQGSATVAMITTAGIIAPAAASPDLGFHPVYLVAVIGFGATTTPWMNDSGFWIVCKMGGMTEGETIKTWTVLLTVIAIVGLFWTWLLATLLPLV